MDAKRIEPREAARRMADWARQGVLATNHGTDAQNAMLDALGKDYESVLDALESLQRVSALPQGWRGKAQMLRYDAEHAAQLGSIAKAAAEATTRCAEQLEIAISED